MNGLSSALLTNTQSTPKWVHVTRRFSALQRNLMLQREELDDGATKVGGVVGSLNRWYWGETAQNHFFLAGSWGKNTAIRPPNDIDIFFIPPIDVFHKYNARSGNKQSQLLQNVREALSTTYPQTKIRGDGQVVVIGFNSVDVEVIPAFRRQGGGYLICDTNDGGRWKHVEPETEFKELGVADAAFNGNALKLTRILKQWKRHCNVPIKSFHIEQLVREALSKYDYGRNSEFWFDWLVRDILAHMHGRAGGGFFMPGTSYEWISMGSSWQSKAWSAYERAVKACDYERNNMNISAGTEWQKIFGPMIPEMVT